MCDRLLFDDYLDWVNWRISRHTIMAYVKSDVEGSLPLVASGKVRDLYELDAQTLLFVATDRISAYDVIMKNVSVYE